MSTDSRAAIVTGGSAGIGRAVARMLAAEGYALTLIARGRERLDEAAAELRAAGADVLAVAANAAEEAELRRAFGSHCDRFGRLDVLVNNAGVGLPRRIDQTSTKQLDLQLSVNLRSAYLLLSWSTELLRTAGGLHGKALVVNVSSMFGLLPQAGTAAYSMTKAALVALSASAHGELSRHGVQVTALCPGFVDTPGAQWAAVEQGHRMLPDDDVAEAVRFLLRTSARCFVPTLPLATAGDDLHDLGMPQQS